MSLVDQSMIPFQDAKVMIVVMIFLILAGNTSFVRPLVPCLHCSFDLDIIAANLVSYPRCHIFDSDSHMLWHRMQFTFWNVSFLNHFTNLSG